MLRGEKVTLRPFQWTDIPYQHRWINDQEVRRYLKIVQEVPLEEVEGWYDVLVDRGGARSFAILSEQGQAIGIIQLRRASLDHGWGELAMLIGEKAYWDRGYGTDAVRTFLRWCFQEMGLRRVELHVLEYNERAMRCYEKCGFRKEGTLRQRFFRDGRHWDVHIMSVLREDWEAGSP